jgi:vacuolar-type H+-ATPase subunit C/Vma6
MRVSGIDGCFVNCGTDPVKMQEAFVADNYSNCTAIMAEACDSVDTEFAKGNRSAQVIDKILDQAMYAEMRTYAKKSSISLVKKLYEWEIDTTNLMLLYRLRKASLDIDSIDNWFVEGGTVKKSLIKEIWNNDFAKVSLSSDLKQFYSLCSVENASLALAEKAQRDKRNQLITDYADSLTIQPVIAYFFHKVDEIDKVRYILISIKNGVNKDVIKNSLK